jgi:hypothetical protein
MRAAVIIGGFLVLAVVILTILYFTSPKTLGIKPATQPQTAEQIAAAALAASIASTKNAAIATAIIAETAATDAKNSATAAAVAAGVALGDINIASASLQQLKQLLGATSTVVTGVESQFTPADLKVKAALLASEEMTIAADDATVAATQARTAANTVATTQEAADNAKDLAVEKKDIAVRQKTYVLGRYPEVTDGATAAAAVKTAIVTALTTSLTASTPAGYTVMANKHYTSPVGHVGTANYVIFPNLGTPTDRRTIESCATECGLRTGCNTIGYEDGTCYFQAVPSTGSIVVDSEKIVTYRKSSA